MSRITQRGATGPLAVQANGTFQTSTDPSLATLTGTRWDLSDGREVVLVLTGVSALVPGKLNQDAALIANHQNLAVTAFQAYSNNGNVPAKVTATLAGTLTTANQYAGGLLIVNDNNGEGQTLRIASNTAQSNTTGSVVVTLEDGPTTALTTASEVCLIPPQGNGVIVTPSSLPTSALRGVSFYNIPAASYGFLVSNGEVACLADGAITANSAISPSNAVAGAVEAGVIAQGLIGNASQAGVDTEYRLVTVAL